MAYHPEVQHGIAEMVMELEAIGAQLETRRAATGPTGVARHPDWPIKIVAAKYNAVEGAWRIVDRALDVSGGFGMFKKSELERLFRDARAGRFHPANRRSRTRSSASWRSGSIRTKPRGGDSSGLGARGSVAQGSGPDRQAGRLDSGIPSAPGSRPHSPLEAPQVGVAEGGARRSGVVDSACHRADDPGGRAVGRAAHLVLQRHRHAGLGQRAPGRIPSTPTVLRSRLIASEPADGRGRRPYQQLLVHQKVRLAPIHTDERMDKYSSPCYYIWKGFLPY